MDKQKTLTVDEINKQLGELAPESQDELLSLLRKRLIAIRAKKTGKKPSEVEKLLGHKKFTQIEVCLSTPWISNMEDLSYDFKAEFRIEANICWFKPEDIEDESRSCVEGYYVRKHFRANDTIERCNTSRKFLKSEILDTYSGDVSRFFRNNYGPYGYVYVPDGFTDYATLTRVLIDIQKEIIKLEQKRQDKVLAKAQLAYSKYLQMFKMSKPRKFSVKECKQICLTSEIPPEKEKPVENPKAEATETIDPALTPEERVKLVDELFDVSK